MRCNTSTGIEDTLDGSAARDVKTIASVLEQHASDRRNWIQWARTLCADTTTLESRLTDTSFLSSTQTPFTSGFLESRTLQRVCECILNAPLSCDEEREAFGCLLYHGLHRPTLENGTSCGGDGADPQNCNATRSNQHLSPSLASSSPLLGSSMFVEVLCSRIERLSRYLMGRKRESAEKWRELDPQEVHYGLTRITTLFEKIAQSVANGIHAVRRPPLRCSACCLAPPRAPAVEDPYRSDAIPAELRQLCCSDPPEDAGSTESTASTAEKFLQLSGNILSSSASSSTTFGKQVAAQCRWEAHWEQRYHTESTPLCDYLSEKAHDENSRHELACEVQTIEGLEEELLQFARRHSLTAREAEESLVSHRTAKDEEHQRQRDQLSVKIGEKDALREQLRKLEEEVSRCKAKIKEVDNHIIQMNRLLDKSIATAEKSNEAAFHAVERERQLSQQFFRDANTVHTAKLFLEAMGSEAARDASMVLAAQEKELFTLANSATEAAEETIQRQAVTLGQLLALFRSLQQATTTSVTVKGREEDEVRQSLGRLSDFISWKRASMKSVSDDVGHLNTELEKLSVLETEQMHDLRSRSDKLKRISQRTAQLVENLIPATPLTTTTTLDMTVGGSSSSMLWHAEPSFVSVEDRPTPPSTVVSAKRRVGIPAAAQTKKPKRTGSLQDVASLCGSSLDGTGGGGGGGGGTGGATTETVLQLGEGSNASPGGGSEVAMLLQRVRQILAAAAAPRF